MRPLVNKVCMVSILVCSLTGILHSQQTQPPQVPAPQTGQSLTSKDWLAGWRDATVSFGTIEQHPLRGKYFNAIGSGIIFSAAGGRKGYIVTAKHVFFDPERLDATKKDYHPSEIQIRYGWQDQKSVYAELGTTIKLRDKSGKDLWTALDDETDLAAIEAPPATIDAQPSTTIGEVVPPGKIFEGARVLVIGYPGIVGSDFLARAITRGGIIAWTDPSDPGGKRLLIDANIYPGNSGGPVILADRTKPDGGLDLGAVPIYLLGLVIQAPTQEAEIDVQVPGQRLPVRVKLQIPVGGTGVVEPVSKVKKLLDKMTM